MSDLDSWPQVVAELQRRLKAKGYPTRLWWVFREDFYQFGDPPRAVCRRPKRGNAALAEKVFRRGRSLGFVRISALARLSGRIVATVWYPDVPENEVRNWGSGAWIKIRNPLRRGIWIPWIFWPLLRQTSAYRAFQRDGWSVGTRQWASGRGPGKVNNTRGGRLSAPPPPAAR